jgi:hypothetical protein
MIDKIALYFPERLIDIELIENPSVSQVRTTGKAGSLQVTKGIDGTYVAGSLPKLLHRNNAFSVEKSEYKDALSEFERITKLNPADGKIMRIELGQTFAVSCPCRDYLSTWGLPDGRYIINRLNNNQTVSYVNKQRAFQGYDKRAEMKAKNASSLFPVHPFLLRLELKVFRGFKRLMGEKGHLSPTDLLLPENWNKAVNLWKDFYFSIPKAKVVVTLPQIELVKQLNNVLQIGGVQFFTKETLFRCIEDSQRSGAIDRKNAYKARSLIRKLENADVTRESSALTNELDSLVRNYNP